MTVSKITAPSLWPVLTTSSGCKKILQISKNALVLINPHAFGEIQFLGQGIHCFEVFEGYREFQSLDDLWKERSKSHLETLCASSFKISYIGTAVAIILQTTSPLSKSILAGLTICSWSLMAVNAKLTLDKEEKEQERKYTQWDLLTSTLEVIGNLIPLVLPVVLDVVYPKKDIFMTTVYTVTPALLSIAAKTAGIGSLIFKPH